MTVSSKYWLDLSFQRGIVYYPTIPLAFANIIIIAGTWTFFIILVKHTCRNPGITLSIHTIEQILRETDDRTYFLRHSILSVSPGRHLIFHIPRTVLIRRYTRGMDMAGSESAQYKPVFPFVSSDTYTEPSSASYLRNRQHVRACRGIGPDP